ncbi:MAG: hypothetical protein A2045_01885 [Rhodocyclales bacterium GWA2_65_20]|nr:MAG: hypothetical protein A2045_01885 [Rhodocyclales bacterium GWA2_65_20]
MRFLVPLVFALCSLSATAALYSWKDADGKVQYSDQPPPGTTQARKLAAPPAPASDADATRKGFAEQEMAARKKQKESQEAAAKAEKEKTEGEARRVNCDKAKGNLHALESGQIRFTTSAKGERVALEGAVREEELASARKAVESWCK